MATAELDIRISSGDVPNATKKLKDLEKQGAATEKGIRDIAGSFASVAAAAGGLAAVGAVLLKSSAAAKKFEKSMSDLSAITGATGEQLKYLEAQAAQIGASTSLSASEAAEAFKLIASAKPDLLESTEALNEVTRAAVTLAEAAGTTLPDAASTLGSALNQFGADADEANRYINVLAAGSKFGAAEVAEVAESLKVSGVSAAAAKVSFEQMNAAIQALSTVSIKGSEAGTALRNIILKLETDTNSKLRPSINGLNGALQNLADMNLTAAELTKQFGMENVNAAQALIANADSLDELTDKLTGTSTAQEQASIRTNNLDGDMKNLESAVESLSISLGNKLNPAARDSAGFLTRLASAAALTIDAMGGAPSTIDGTAFALSKVNARIKELEGMGKRYGSIGLIDAIMGNTTDKATELAELRKEADRLQAQYVKLQGIGSVDSGEAKAAKERAAAAKAEADKKASELLRRERELADAAEKAASEKAAEKAAREAKSASSAAAAAQREYDSKITAIAREQQAEADDHASRLQAAGEFNARMDALNASEPDKARNDRGQRMVENQMYFNNGLITEEQYQINLTAIKSKYTDERIAIEENELRAKQMLQSSMLGSASGFFDGLAGMAEAAAGEQSGIYRATFALSKGFATAKAALDMQMAISDAMSKGFPQNIPLMAQAASAGAQIASTIGGLNYSGAYDKGGYIPAGSFGIGSEKRDEFINGVLVKGPARITGGTQTEKKIEAAASGGGGMTVYITQNIQGNGDQALAEVVDRATKNALNECQSDFATNGRLRKTLGV